MGYYDINKNIGRTAWVVGIALYLLVNGWAMSVAMSEPDMVRMPIDTQIEAISEKQGVDVERLSNTGHGGSAVSRALSREYLVNKAHTARTPVYYVYRENDNGFLEKEYWTNADNSVFAWKDIYEPNDIHMGFLQYDGVRDGYAYYDVDAGGPLLMIAVAMLVVSFFAGAITLVVGIFAEGICHCITRSDGTMKQDE